MEKQMVKKEKFLVTGGAGFIGSNLVDRLLEQNNQVVCLDNFSTGKYENLEQALKNPAFTLIEGDIRNYKDCLKAAEGCNYVLHHAALGSVPRSIADPVTSTEVNIGGFVKMLYAAKEAGIKRFIYASSSAAYGDHQDLPKVEHKIGKALSPYAVTKLADELFARNFSEIYGIETIGLRYFNVFGRRQDPNGAYAAVIPRFVNALIHYESPQINGDGSYSRDFTYIENVLQANQLAAEIPSAVIRKNQQVYYREKVIDFNVSATTAEVFNIAFGQRTSLTELAQALKKNLSRFDPEIEGVIFENGPVREGDVSHSLASCEKVRTILGYKPTHSVFQGLKETCEWYWITIKNKS
jgi:UDP-N-acetylglucosamine 4-epimerase